MGIMRKQQGGFTLLEVLIVVAILGIVSALAYNSYTRQADDSRRSDAASMLVNAAQQLERCYTRVHTYDVDNVEECNDLPDESPGGHYRLNSELDTNTFTVTAVPQGVQAERDAQRCAFLALDHTGRRTAEDGDGNEAVDECWRG